MLREFFTERVSRLEMALCILLASSTSVSPPARGEDITHAGSPSMIADGRVYIATDPNKIILSDLEFPVRWVMRVTSEGRIQFNREGYPELTEDDFAKRVLEILETMTFCKETR